MHPHLSALTHRLASGWGRAVVVLLGCGLLALLLSVDAVHGSLQWLLKSAEPVIAAHPYTGMLVFIALSALSAMLAFFSSALLVPVAIYSWGVVATMGLLWIGWFLGGACAFAIGRTLRHPLVRSRDTAKAIDAYVERIPGDARFVVVFLLQLALPSEVPGYLCGVLGVRFRTYAPALALAELPFAVGTVLVGESVVQRQGGWLVVLGVAGAGVCLYAAYLLHKKVGR